MNRACEWVLIWGLFGVWLLGGLGASEVVVDRIRNLRHDVELSHREELHATTAFMKRNQRLQASASRAQSALWNGLSRNLSIQFEAFGKEFTVKMRRVEGLLPEGFRIVRADREDAVDADNANVHELRGSAYDGHLIIIKDAAPNTHTNSVSSASVSLATSNELQPAVHPERTVLKNPMARFYVEKVAKAGGNALHIEGSFVWNEEVYRVHSNLHPTHVRDDSNDEADDESEDEDYLLVSKDDEASASVEHGHDHAHGQGLAVKPSRQRYRCAHDGSMAVVKSNWNEPELAAATSAAAKSKRAKKNKKTKQQKSGDALQTAFSADSSGCPASRRALYVGVVADSAYMASFKGNKERALASIIAEFGLVSAIYERTFNIELGLISIALMDAEVRPGDPKWNVGCDADMGMEDRLSAFSEWRGSQSADAGMFHLMTGCAEKETVGISWMGHLCQTDSHVGLSGDRKLNVSGTSVSALIRNQFAVIAHEFGHSFGAAHDCVAEDCVNYDGTDCGCCPCAGSAGGCDCQGAYLMTPSVGFLGLKEFSACSRTDMCGRMQMYAKCLREPGSLPTKKIAVCGNGIVEEGEECDCGSEAECAGNPCCTADCRLRSNAQCSDDNHVCCKDCLIRTAEEAHVCASSNTACQYEATCDGRSPKCPAIKTAPDGTECEVAGAACAAGVCTSRDLQCRTMGRRQGITTACPSTRDTCLVTCMTSPGMSKARDTSLFALMGQCVRFDAHFIDGTPCGRKGRCSRGVCSERRFNWFGSRDGADGIGGSSGNGLATAAIIVIGGLLGAAVFIAAIKSVRACWDHIQWHRHRRRYRL